MTWSADIEGMWARDGVFLFQDYDGKLYAKTCRQVGTYEVEYYDPKWSEPHPDNGCRYLPAGFYEVRANDEEGIVNYVLCFDIPIAYLNLAMPKGEALATMLERREERKAWWNK